MPPAKHICMCFYDYFSCLMELKTKVCFFFDRKNNKINNISKIKTKIKNRKTYAPREYFLEYVRYLSRYCKPIDLSEKQTQKK